MKRTNNIDEISPVYGFPANGKEKSSGTGTTMRVHPGGMHILQLSPSYQTLNCSNGLYRLSGYPPDSLQEPEHDYRDWIHEEDRMLYQAFIARMTRTPGIETLEYRICCKDGSIRHLSDTLESQKVPGERILGYSSITDITDAHQREAALLKDASYYKSVADNLHKNHEKFRLAAAFTGVVIFEIDMLRHVCVSLYNTEAVLGADSEALLASIQDATGEAETIYRLSENGFRISEEDYKTIRGCYRELMQRGIARCEIRIAGKDGNYKWYVLHNCILRDSEGNPVSMVGFIIDTDQAHRKEDALRNQIMVDSVTRLYNKRTAFRLIDQSLKDLPRHPHALAIFDIDNFKSINDTFGHHTGDQVLAAFSECLRQSFREDDLLARSGNDEFLAFFPFYGSSDCLQIRLEPMMSAFKEKVSGIHPDLSITLSIGAVLSCGIEDVQILVQHAEGETHEAQLLGGNRLSCRRIGTWKDSDRSCAESCRPTEPNASHA